MNFFLTIFLISSLIYITDAGECQVHNQPDYLSVVSNKIDDDDSNKITVSNFANNLQTLLGLSSDKNEKQGKPIFYSSRPLEIPSSTWLFHIEGLDQLSNTGIPLADNGEFNIDSIYSKLRDNGNEDALNTASILVTSEDMNKLKETIESHITQMDKDALIKYIVIVCDECQTGDNSIENLKTQLKSVIDQIIADDPQTLAMTLTTKQSARVRRARQVNSDDGTANVTLAKMYSVNYPVMFNLFFWTSLVLVLVLISIVYVFLTLDPGSDSIIYRMTAPRLKVD